MIAALLFLVLGTPFSITVLQAQQEEFMTCRSFPSPFQQREQPGPVLSKAKFLVAGRNMRDPRFAEAVLLLVEYGTQGAMGLIINRPTDVKLSLAFPKIGGLKQSKDIIYVGGPVNPDRMFLLIRSKAVPDDSLHVFEDIYVSSSEKALRQMIGSANAGKRFHVYAGYAGWSPRQLDHEVMRGDWHIVQADARTIFDKKSSEIWPELIQQRSRLWVRAKGDHLPLIASQ